MQHVRAPLYVASAPAKDVKPLDAVQGLATAPPRFQFRQVALPSPPGLYTIGMFRPRLRRVPPDHAYHGQHWGTQCPCHWQSACQVPHRVYIVHDRVDEAMQSAVALVVALENELGAILSHVGCNADMIELLRDSACCWNWADLVVGSPTVQHVQAFRHVCDKLQGWLQQALYLDGVAFSSAGSTCFS